jgi:hypothetical protein
LFAESVRAALDGWEPPREPELGSWQDDRDDALAGRLADAGWSELWAGEELLAAAVAGGVELGRAAAPISLVDEVTLGAPLCIDGRARHGRGAATLALPQPGGQLALGVPRGEIRAEPTFDGSGTVEVEIEAWSPLEPVAASACWRAWNAATLAYVAGLAARALELSVEHARSREQFGAPLAAIPAVQSRLADAALATEALTLLAWAAAGNERFPDSELRWAGTACCEVTASAHQVHGALGFALESGLHLYYRRARSVQAWATAACDATGRR